MTDDGLEPTLAAARRAAPALTAGRHQKWRWAVMSRLDRGRRVPVTALVLGCGAAAAIGIFAWRQLAPRPSTVASSPEMARPAAPVPGPLPARVVQTLADGSRIVVDDPSTVLEKAIEANDHVLFELQSGGARFEVAKRPSRTFRVHAGPVALQVIGTRFQVQRLGDRSRISVTEGRVLVSWWGGSRELGAGEEGTFPPDGIASRATPAPPSAPTSTFAVVRRSAPEVGPDVLFARADRARKAGKPEQAVVHLRAVVDRYPGDPHAKVAAFTVGRLLLESLGQPRQAAASFEKARALAKGGPLAEDALAREVEAWGAAGDHELARRRAELYRQLYPSGPRLKAVLRSGGLVPREAKAAVPPQPIAGGAEPFEGSAPTKPAP